MKLTIEHTTTFLYDKPISEAYTEMRLRPLDANGQHTLSFALHTEPQDEALQYRDRFGNDVRHFDAIEPHQRLLVAARSEVLTPARFVQDAQEALSPLDEYDYLMETDYVSMTPEIRQLGAGLGVPGAPDQTALNIQSAIHGLLRYQKGLTDVTTTAARALALGGGVCQDFSHLMLAVCRSLNLPARYVSGYLYNNGFSTATHAWVDVYIAGQGWLALDPTHNREQTEHYVRVAVGRDYADVPPTRGVFVGNGREEMEVSVTVKA